MALLDKHKIRKKRTWWSRKWLLRRNEGRGAGSLVFEELKIEHLWGFKNFTRMRTQTFDLLLSKVGQQLQKQNTNMRECIAPDIRLLVTLRFLATGETFQSLSYNFRISVPALSSAIIECCIVLYEALKEDFLRTPRSEKEWRKIDGKLLSLWNFPMCLGARRVVENAFGILSNKFQVLQKDINMCVTKVQQVTMTCCALHNFIKQKDGKNYFMNIVDVENTTAVTLSEGEWRRNVFMADLQPNTVNRSANGAIAIRETFTKYFNEVGQVPWQKEAVKKFNF